MELSDLEKNIIIDLIKIAWQAGAIRSPEQAQAVTQLAQKVQTRQEK